MLLYRGGTHAATDGRIKSVKGRHGRACPRSGGRGVGQCAWAGPRGTLVLVVRAGRTTHHALVRGGGAPGTPRGGTLAAAAAAAAAAAVAALLLEGARTPASLRLGGTLARSAPVASFGGVGANFRGGEPGLGEAWRGDKGGPACARPGSGFLAAGAPPDLLGLLGSLDCGEGGGGDTLLSSLPQPPPQRLHRACLQLVGGGVGSSLLMFMPGFVVVGSVEVSAGAGLVFFA